MCKFSLVTALLAAMTPAVVFACPTSEDLKTGIVFKLTDGTTEVYRSLGDNRIEAIWSDGSHKAIRNVLVKGTYLIDFANIHNGKLQDSGRSITKYPVPDNEAPYPKSGYKWNVTVKVTEYGDTFRSNEDYVFGPEQKIDIGSCQYTGFVITHTYLDMGPENYAEYLWLEELKLSIPAKESYGFNDFDIFEYSNVKKVE